LAFDQNQDQIYEMETKDFSFALTPFVQVLLLQLAVAPRAECSSASGFERASHMAIYVN
jgi:hypothetical protein